MSKGFIGIKSTVDNALRAANSVNKYSVTGVSDIYEAKLVPSNWDKSTSHPLYTPNIGVRASATQSFTTPSTTGTNGFYISNDGTLLFTADNTTFYKYSLSTAYDITTATLVTSGTLVTLVGSDTGATIRGLTFNSNGTRIFVIDSNGAIRSFALASAWNISSQGSNVITIFTITSSGGQHVSLFWSGDGLRLYAIGAGPTSTYLYQFAATSAYTVPAGIYVGSPLDISAAHGGASATYNPCLAANFDGSLLLMSVPTSGVDKFIHTISNTDTTQPVQANWTFTGKFSVLDALRGWPYGQLAAINETYPINSMMFGDSGRSLYVMTAGVIYRILLAKAYSLDSYQPTNQFALLRAVQTGTGLFLKPDGTKMYITDTSTDAVYQYSLSTADDVSTAVLDATKRKLMDEDGTMNAITFKGDGTKMFAIGDSSNKVYQYDLSTAWDISTATYTAASVSLAETTPTGLAFSNTGGTLYVIGENSDSINTYELSTPWDITSAGIFNSTAQDTTMRGFCFGNSGSSAYAIGYQNNKIYEYAFAIPYNTRSLSYVRSYTLSSIVPSARIAYGGYDALAVSSDGTKVYVLETTSRTIYTLDLGTAWNISTASFNNKLRTITDVELTPTTFSFNSDGTRMYVTGTTSDNIVEYILATAWDITTARRDTTVEPFPTIYSAAVLEAYPQDMEFSNTGSQVYFMGTTTDKLTQYDLSVPYDLGTIQLPYKYKSYRTSTTYGESYINSAAGGTKMFWLNITTASIDQYTLTTPHDVSTAVYDNISFTPSTATYVLQTIAPTAIAFNPAGTRLYMLTASGVYQYELVMPWSLNMVLKAESTDIAGTTNVNVSNSTHAPMDTAANGLAFNNDGTQMFVAGFTTDTVKTYTLRTAWDVTTAILRKHTNVTDSTLSIAFYNNNGTKMYVLGNTTNVLYQYALPTAYDISSASIATNGHEASFSVATQATGCVDAYFKSDGTAFYVVASTRIIYQYALGTAWDLSTASYTNKSYNVSARDTAMTYLAFSDDGTKLYVGGITSDTISRHAMTTAWDISTASFETAQTKSVLAQDTTMQSLTFKPDGTRAFMLGATADRLFQYDLTTAWDITTLTYNSVSANVAHMTATGSGVSFTSDGTKLLIADGTTSVWPATLTTAWDISTLASDTTKSILTQTTNVTSVGFSSDGSKMYTTAANGIFEYTLNAAWKPDSAQATVTGINPTTNIIPAEVLINDVRFTPNGTIMYVAGSTLDTVHQLTLATPWVTNTAVYPIATQQKSLTLTEITGTAMRFTSNGSILYVVGTTNDTVQKYVLSTPWDVSTATSTQSYIVNSVNGGSLVDPTCIDVSADGYSLYVGAASTLLQYRMTSPHDLSTISAPRTLVSAQDAAVSEMRFSSDGTKMYVVGPTTTERVLQTTLSQAYRPSTAGSWTSVTVVEDTSMQGLYFSDDGTKMYLLGITNDTVYQYTLATAWDVATASYASKSLLISGQEITGSSIIFGDSGTKMYLVGTSSDNIRQYTLSTAWDISTATYASKTLSVLAQDTTSAAIFFKPDGTRVFMVGTSGDIVRGYNLGTAWDISTAVYSSALDKSIALQEATATGLEFSSDGTKMFVVGSTNDYIYTYTLGTAWDPSTARAEHYAIATAPQCIRFNTDGTKLHVLHAPAGGTSTANVFTYTLSTGWEIGTITSNAAFSTVTQVERAVGFAFNGDGTKMICLNANNSGIAQARSATYTLATPYTPNTAYVANTSTLRLTFPDAAPMGIKLSTAGDKMLLLGNTTATVYSFTLGSNNVAWTGTQSGTLTLPVQGYRAIDAIANTIAILQTAGPLLEYYTPNDFSLTGATLARDASLSAQDGTPSGIYFKSDGLKVYMMGRTNSYVNEYTLTSAYNLGTISYTRQFSVASQTTSATEVFFNDAGTKMYVVSSANKTVYQYTLGTAWNISTATYSTSYLAASIDDTTYTGITLSRDGKYLYVINSSSDNLYRFTLSTPFSLSTLDASTKQTLYVGAVNVLPSSISFSIDGKYLFITNTSPGKVSKYTLSTAWDLSTATYTEQKTVSTPAAFNISDDGKIMISTYGPGLYTNKYLLSNSYSLASSSASKGTFYMRAATTNATATYTTVDPIIGQQFLSGGEYCLTLTEANTPSVSYANTFQTLQIRGLIDPYTANASFDSVRTVPLTLGNTTLMSVGDVYSTSNGTTLYVVDNLRYMIYQFERI